MTDIKNEKPKFDKIENKKFLEHFQKYCSGIKWTETGDEILKMCHDLMDESKSVHTNVLNLPDNITSFNEIVKVLKTIIFVISLASSIR